MHTLHYALRALAKSPGFALTAILTLAAGIGASTAIFTTVDAVLLHPLPYPNSAQLVLVTKNMPQFELFKSDASALDFVDYRDLSRSFSQMAAIETNSVNLTGDDEPLRVAGLRVSTSLFPMLGVEPVAGRLFRPEVEQLGKERVALLGEGLWKSRFGADPRIAGKQIEIDTQKFTVVDPPRRPRQTDRNRYAEVHRGRRGGAGSAIHGAGATLRAAGIHSGPTGPQRARPSKHRRGGAAEARGDPRSGPRGDEAGSRPHDAQTAGMVSGGLEHRTRSAGRFGCGRTAHAAAGAAERRRHGVADRLRERGKPAVGPRHRPPEGDWPAHRAGRRARADRAATADRESAAGRDFGSGRPRDRRLGAGVVHAHRL